MRFLVLLLAPALAVAAPQGPDDDFEEDRPVPSIALVALGSGSSHAAVEVGWLRSGLRAGLGVTNWLSIVAQVDSMLLYRGLNAQNGLAAGLRFNPYRGPWRAALELAVGQVVIPVDSGSRSLPVVRVEVSAGLVTEHLGAYSRLGLRRLGSSSASGTSGWTGDLEAGVGVEAPVGWGITLGGEVFSWARPGLAPLLQWRLRLGYER